MEGMVRIKRISGEGEIMGCKSCILKYLGSEPVVWCNKYYKRCIASKDCYEEEVNWQQRYEELVATLRDVQCLIPRNIWTRFKIKEETK